MRYYGVKIISLLSLKCFMPRAVQSSVFNVQRPIPQPGTRNAEPGTVKRRAGEGSTVIDK